MRALVLCVIEKDKNKKMHMIWEKGRNQMYISKTVIGKVILEKGLLDTFIPPTGTSSKWKHWKATLDLKTCVDCRRNHGKIYAITEVPNPEPPLHPNCRCIVESMESVIAGMASNEGINGADWRLQYRGVLPDYYIHINDLIALGWRRGKPLVKFAPGKMVCGNYRNEEGHLPDAPGREWYEADLNYYSGKRNSHRVLWSNDGLIFVTYNHCASFIEVIGG